MTKKKLVYKSSKKVNSDSLAKIYRPKFNKLEKILKGIAKKSTNNFNGIFSDLHSILENEVIYIQALGDLRPNKGVGTPGTNQETLDSMDLNKIKKICKQMKEGTFKFGPFRRVYIPKPGKKKKRPLGIPNFMDRIVQGAIRIILESIYEPVFKTIDCNFGFRRGLSPHDAIKRITRAGTACNYALEGDIVGAYDNVNVEKLIKILGKRISDKKFLNLIKQGCYCGMLDMGKRVDTLLGVPQGGIASPILFNIYMNEFDLYINNKLTRAIEIYNKLHGRSFKPVNKEWKRNDYYVSRDYKQVTNFLNNRKMSELSPEEKNKLKILVKTKKQSSIARSKIPSILVRERNIRIIYVRYADDWIILTNSNKRFVYMLRKRIEIWLKVWLNLELSKEKTVITNLKTGSAKFLGFLLRTYKSLRFNLSRKTSNFVRQAGYNVISLIDMERVLNRLRDRGFCNEKFIPIGKNPFSVLPIEEIITKYNYMLRGSANYYIPVLDRYRDFTRIAYILQYSCYGTIAKKLNSSIFKIFNKYGKPPIFNVNVNTKLKENVNRNEEINIQTTKAYKLLTYLELKELALEINKKKIVVESDIFNPLQRVNWRTYKNLNAYCLICGTRDKVEWHHVNHIRKGKVTGFQQVMNQLNRKQVPLCKKHHLEVEKGLYHDIKISDLVETSYWLS